MQWDSYDIAQLLARLDDTAVTGTEEVVATRVLQLCLDQVPGLARGLTDVDEIEWWERGGHHHGDLVARSVGGDVLAHVEVKSRYAQINWPKNPCKRGGCPGGSQVDHMLEDGRPVLLIAPPGATSHSQLEHHSSHLKTFWDRAILRTLTWQDVKAKIESVPRCAVQHPLQAMLGVGD